MWSCSSIGRLPARRTAVSLRANEVNHRARDLMVGIAADNLLGIVREGWPRRQTAARYPDGVREIAAAAGNPDDDPRQRPTYRGDRAGTAPPTELGQRSWAETNGLGMGALPGHVLERLPGRRRDPRSPRLRSSSCSRFMLPHEVPAPSAHLADGLCNNIFSPAVNRWTSSLRVRPRPPSEGHRTDAVLPRPLSLPRLLAPLQSPQVCSRPAPSCTLRSESPH